MPEANARRELNAAMLRQVASQLAELLFEGTASDHCAELLDEFEGFAVGTHLQKK